MRLQIKDRVRLNKLAQKFGIQTVSQTGTVLVTPKAEMVLVKIDEGPEISLHRDFLNKIRVAERPAPAGEVKGEK